MAEKPRREKYRFGLYLLLLIFFFLCSVCFFFLFLLCFIYLFFWEGCEETKKKPNKQKKKHTHTQKHNSIRFLVVVNSGVWRRGGGGSSHFESALRQKEMETFRVTSLKLSRHNCVWSWSEDGSPMQLTETKTRAQSSLLRGKITSQCDSTRVTLNNPKRRIHKSREIGNYISQGLGTNFPSSVCAAATELSWCFTVGMQHLLKRKLWRTWNLYFSQGLCTF